MTNKTAIPAWIIFMEILFGCIIRLRASLSKDLIPALPVQETRMDARNQVPIVFSPRSGVWIILLILCTACAARQVPSSNQEPVSGSQATQEVVVPATIRPTFTALTENPSATAVEESLPTSENSSSEGRFSLDEMQREKPTDILKRQFVYWIGGGAGDNCGLAGESEILFCPSESINRYRYVRISLGGLHPGSQVDMMIRYPDGQRTLTINLVVDPQGNVEYKFIPTLAEPLGMYQVFFDPSTGIDSKVFQVVEDTRPRLVVIPEEHRIVLFNWKPKESLRVYLYQKSDPSASQIRLIGWQSYHADEKGQLTLDIPPEIEALFVAVGDTSGVAYKEEAGSEWTNQDWTGPDVYCPGLLPPQELAQFSALLVSVPNIPVRSDHPAGAVLRSIPQASVIRLDPLVWYSPLCESGTFWYAIDCTSLPGMNCSGNRTLWMPEIVGNEYALQPVGISALPDPSQPTSIPQSLLPALEWPMSDTGVEACHISAGDTVSAGEQARLWSEPDVTSGRSLASLPAGEILVVMNGPVWGKIRGEPDFFGWWYEVEIGSMGRQGWLWQDRIAECRSP
jgi:hypothetical protein